ncbi:hypothetical protein KO498_09085 [Lentibacter algarum]|uniref:DUF6194 family protein n=1 Tax=Lentibacter algarum TaxID=576131 RepID=UPI001C065047|nr:DUF6194 family protein [Lentibacter algarum]MBU2981969.1 hypothetical protein [Lentibacter algarum]
MSPETILTDLLARYAGTVSTPAWGETTLFYNPDNTFKRGAYFATIKEKNGDHDQASELDREGVFRLNIGATRPLFEARFGNPPARPTKGGHVHGPWDFIALDSLTPHPVYGWMSWVSILNPSEASFASCLELLDSAYVKATATFNKRLRAAAR